VVVRSGTHRKIVEKWRKRKNERKCFQSGPFLLGDSWSSSFVDLLWRTQNQKDNQEQAFVKQYGRRIRDAQDLLLVYSVTPLDTNR